MKNTLSIQIFNCIVDGKDGTLRTDTGLGSLLPTTGYFVGGVGKPLVFDSREDANTPDALARIAAFIDAQCAEYIGWWADSETGKVYVDGTSWFRLASEASEAAFQRHEIAFWDIDGACEWRFAYVPVEG